MSQENPESSAPSSLDFSHPDPFDFSREGQDNPLDNMDFNLNEDGEMVVSSPEISGVAEKDSDDSIVESKDSESSESTEEVKSSELSLPSNYIKNPFDLPEVKALKESESELTKENEELKQRIEALEGKFNQQVFDKTREEREREIREKFENAGFLDEQIDLILELLPVQEQTTQSIESEIKENKEDTWEPPSEAEVAREAATVVGTYTGKDGMPSVDDMKPLVNFSFLRFKDMGLEKLPLTATFRIAENAPFIQYLDNNYPERMKKLSIREVFTVSENLRRAWNQNKGLDPHSFDYLKELKKAQSSVNGSVGGSEKKGGENREKKELSGSLTNDQVKKISAESQERNLNVPGGEVETEEEVSERNRPKSAREVVTATLAAFGED